MIRNTDLGSLGTSHARGLGFTGKKPRLVPPLSSFQQHSQNLLAGGISH
jgi:hypothetical protein